MSSHRILIVEDVTMIADFMALILGRHGYQVSGIVSTGEEAVKVAGETSPDLVLMDIKLEGFVDGIEAADKIRRFCNVPVVFVSAHTDAAIIQRAIATGASGYLIKPFKGKDLLFALERALGRKEGGLDVVEPFTLNLPCSTTQT
jgi:DNA-binding response OmpR family regulator